MSPPSVQVSGSGLAARRGWRSGDRGFYRRELSLFVGAYVVYHAARWLFTGDLSQAQWHAEAIMRFERELGLAVEASVQDSLDVGLWSPFFSYVYMAAQLVVLPGSLVWLYRRAPGVYRPLRNTVLGTWLIAIPIYAIFPVAPPRLAHPGIVDAVSEQAGFALTGRSTLFFNPLAAVPSLHVGFAFAIGIAAAAALRAPAAKALALLWGPVVSLAVVVTGNHYVFDIAAGLVVTAIGYAVTRPTPRGRRRGVLVHVRLADAPEGAPFGNGGVSRSPGWRAAGWSVAGCDDRDDQDAGGPPAPSDGLSRDDSGDRRAPIRAPK